MYEYHGWVALHSSPENGDRADLDRVAIELRDRLAELSDPGVAGLQAINGTYFLWVVGHANRPGVQGKIVHALFQFIAKAAPGSYGLLYERDDESPPPMDNSFRAWRLARGDFSEVRDALLSPCVPIIEI